MDPEQKPPIFEVGVARSGTTILSLMLDAHPRIAIPYESHFFVDYYRNRDSVNRKLANPDARKEVMAGILNERYVREWDYTPSLESLDLSECTDLAGAIRAVYEAYADHHGKDIWGDKTPGYITHINVLNDLFPDAKFIHLIRDGRDVALSLMKQWFGPNDFVSALKFWKERALVGERMLAMLPADRVFALKMEELALYPEETLRNLCHFLEIEFVPEMLTAFNQNAAAKVGDRIGTHHTGLSGPLDISNVTRWDKELSAADQAIAWEYAGSLFEEFGYPTGIKRHWAKSYRKVYHRFSESIQWRLKRNQASAT